MYTSTSTARRRRIVRSPKPAREDGLASQTSPQIAPLATAPLTDQDNRNRHFERKIDTMPALLDHKQTHQATAISAVIDAAEAVGMFAMQHASSETSRYGAAAGITQVCGDEMREYPVNSRDLIDRVSKEMDATSVGGSRHEQLATANQANQLRIRNRSHKSISIGTADATGLSLGDDYGQSLIASIDNLRSGAEVASNCEFGCFCFGTRADTTRWNLLDHDDVTITSRSAANQNNNSMLAAGLSVEDDYDQSLIASIDVRANRPPEQETGKVDSEPFAESGDLADGDDVQQGNEQPCTTGCRTEQANKTVSDTDVSKADAYDRSPIAAIENIANRSWAERTPVRTVSPWIDAKSPVAAGVFSPKAIARSSQHARENAITMLK